MLIVPQTKIDRCPIVFTFMSARAFAIKKTRLHVRRKLPLTVKHVGNSHHKSKQRVNAENTRSIRAERIIHLRFRHMADVFYRAAHNVSGKEYFYNAFNIIPQRSEFYFVFTSYSWKIYLFLLKKSVKIFMLNI